MVRYDGSCFPNEKIAKDHRKISLAEVLSCMNAFSVDHQAIGNLDIPDRQWCKHLLTVPGARSRFVRGWRCREMWHSPDFHKLSRTMWGSGNGKLYVPQGPTFEIQQRDAVLKKGTTDAYMRCLRPPSFFPNYHQHQTQSLDLTNTLVHETHHFQRSLRSHLF